MQKKKMLVLAIGAVLAVPDAFAQRAKEEDADSVVVLYGKVYPEIVRARGSGATAAGTTVATFAGVPSGGTGIIGRNEIESSNSRLGVRGHEKLGGGLKAVWQLETQFIVDTVPTPFAARDSWVGLNHAAWGTIKLGRFDTPFKDYGDDISFLGVSSGNFTSTSAVFRRFGFGSSNQARFHERRQNAIQYESPEIGGVEFKVQYSTDENKTATRDPHTWSIGGEWEFRGVKIMLAHEIHKDLFGGSRNMPVSSMANTNDQAVRSKDTASAVAVQWKMGNHTFEVDVNQKKWVETGTSVVGRFGSYKNRGYLVGWDARWSQQWRTGMHWVKSTAGECSRVAAVCVTNGLGGTQVSAGVAYHFSRRTYLFFMASWVKNDFSATFNTLANQSPAVGEDYTQYAVGLHTSF